MGELRQFRDEAEALLQPGQETKVTPSEEAGKIRRALCKLLGNEVQVERALGFMRERQPLGETDDADELLLQVEISDFIGDEGVHALPLLERCLELEVAMGLPPPLVVS